MISKLEIGNIIRDTKHNNHFKIDVIVMLGDADGYEHVIAYRNSEKETLEIINYLETTVAKTFRNGKGYEDTYCESNTPGWDYWEEECWEIFGSWPWNEFMGFGSYQRTTVTYINQDGLECLVTLK